MMNTDPEETLIISTADHGHAVTFNGYCGRGSPVTGLCYEIDPEGTMHLPTPNLAEDGATYTVLSIGNGGGSILYVSDHIKEKVQELFICELHEREELKQLTPMFAVYMYHNLDESSLYAKRGYHISFSGLCI